MQLACLSVSATLLAYPSGVWAASAHAQRSDARRKASPSSAQGDDLPLWSYVDLLPRPRAVGLAGASNGADSSVIQRVTRSSTKRLGNRSAVDVFIGSGGHGHTFPGATRPWGMVQATPWTHSPKLDPWDTQSGYSSEAHNPAFYGMAHSALSGAGSGEMGELRLLPLAPGATDRDSVMLSGSTEASPGYFATEVAAVDKQDRLGPSLKIRSSATLRGAVHEFEFPDAANRSLMVLLSEAPNTFWGWQLLEFRHQVVSDRRFEGCTLGIVTGMGNAFAHLCFVIEFDQAFNSKELDPAMREGRVLEDTPPDVTFSFTPGSSKTLVARVAVSRTDLTHARAAFAAEVQGRSLQDVLAASRAHWDQALGVMRVRMPSPKHTRMLYSALYHSMISPNLLSDGDGSYRLQKLKKGSMPRNNSWVSFGQLEETLPLRKTQNGGSIYHTFSAWDTYRSLHPLMNLIQPNVSRYFGDSLMTFFDSWGYLPSWQLLQSPTDMMEGDGGSIILSTMALNGLTDKKKALELLAEDRMEPVDKRGCMGNKDCMGDKISEILEQAKADSCVAKLAGQIGNPSLVGKFTKRAHTAFEMWDEQQGVFAPLDLANKSTVKGKPVRLHAFLGDLESSSEMYREGSPLQYSWSAEFDVEKMIAVRHGKKGFVCALDKFFYGSNEQAGTADMTGSFGALSIGNEPTMHTPYLYSLAGYPSRTQELLGTIIEELFSDAADGLPGNDDLGQMSSWIVFTLLGLYPVDPCSGEYALGRPFVEEAELLMEGTRKLKVKVNEHSDNNKYVMRLQWQGKDLDVARPKLTFDMLSAGGLLEFWMSSRANDGAPPRCEAKGNSLRGAGTKRTPPLRTGVQ